MFLVTHDSLRAIVKLDVNGDLAWSKIYPAILGGPWEVRGSAATNDGGAVMITAFEEADVDTPDEDHITLSRIDASGLLVWSRRYGVARINENSLVVPHVHSNGSDQYFIYLAAPDIGLEPQRIMKVDGLGDVLWSVGIDHMPADYPGQKLVPTPFGGCLLLCWPHPSDGPLLVSLFADDGSLTWARSIRMTNESWALTPGAGIQTSTGDVYLMGDQMSTGAGDFFAFLIKISATGDLLWYRLYGTAGLPDTHLHQTRDIVELPSGDLAIGSTRFNLFDTSGVHYSSLAREFDSYTYGSTEHGLSVSSVAVVDGDFISTGNWIVTDVFFNYTYFHPVVMRTRQDLSGSCGWQQGPEDLASDTLVPPAFVEFLDLGTPVNIAWSYVDTVYAEMSAPLSMGEFCPLLNVEEMPPGTPRLVVVPSLATKGSTIRVDAPSSDRIELLDAVGGSVLTVQVHPGMSCAIPTSSLASGFYLVRSCDVAGNVLGTSRVVLE